MSSTASPRRSSDVRGSQPSGARPPGPANRDHQFHSPHVRRCSRRTGPKTGVVGPVASEIHGNSVEPAAASQAAEAREAPAYKPNQGNQLPALQAGGRRFDPGWLHQEVPAGVQISRARSRHWTRGTQQRLRRAACPALRTGRPRARDREARDPDRAAVRRVWDRRRGVHRARHATAAGRRVGSLRRARSRRQRPASVALVTATATTSSAGWRRSMGSRAAVLGSPVCPRPRALR